MLLPAKSPKHLTASQKKAWRVMLNLLKNTVQADLTYNSLPQSKNGRIISTDIARFLDDRYANPTSGKPRDIVPGWDLAWRYAQDRFMRELQSRGRRTIVRFMAGGWAAGKTHALEHHEPPDLTWDGTLSDAEWAARMIDLALKNDWKVEIAYVFRDIELAFYGSVERGKKEGRFVPLDLLPKSHGDAQRTMISLSFLYASEPNVSFILLHNLGTQNVQCAPRELSILDLAKAGALHYGDAYESYYIQVASEIGKSSAQS